MPQFNEMIEYLTQQDNCSVHGQGFQVKNLHSTINKYKSMIEHHKPEVRNKSVYCISLKGSLERIYNAYLDGKIDTVGKVVVKPFATKIV